MQIRLRLQMTVASNCPNVKSFDLRVKPKTALNKAEGDESKENSRKRENTFGMTLKSASKTTSFEALLDIW